MRPFRFGSLVGLAVFVSQVVASPATGAEKVVKWWMGSWWKDQAPKVAQRYEKEHPGVRIAVETPTITGYLDKLITATLGGSPPDLAMVNDFMAFTMDERNLVIPWDGHLDGLNTNDFFPVAWKGFQRKGRVLGLPYRLDTESVVFYNKAMLDEAGLKYPAADWTYKDLLAYAQKLNKPPRYGLCIAGALTNPINISTQLLPAMRAWGGDVLDSSMTKVTINQKPAVEAVQWWVELYAKHKVVPPGTLNNNFVDCASLFGAEQVAMFISGPGGYNYLDVTRGTKDIKIGTVPQPDHQARVSIVGIIVPVGAAQPEEARKFGKWFINNLGELTIRTPATKPAYKFPPWNTPKMAAFIEAVGWGKPTPPLPQWTEMEIIMSKEFQNALLQAKSVQQAMDDAAAAMQKLLDTKR